MKQKFTVTRLTALAGVCFFAVMSATVECAKPLRMVQLFSEINGLYITAYWPDGALRVDSVAYSHDVFKMILFINRIIFIIKIL